ncbi:MAG: hypothetical protein K2O00_02650 [Muribaculaceae bacterium]|nr:hypothetical protein [Muribaculaceae bacterium]
MKKLIFISLLIFQAVALTAQETARVELKHFSSKESKDFPFEREILIYTPMEYDRNTASDCDVVYVFDSQWRSHFDLVCGLLESEQDETENELPFIVVGVISPTKYELEYHRNNDFLPVPVHEKPTSPFYGNAENFKKFLKETVMPYINENYRTSGHTLAIGHSLGASFILDALATDEMFDDYIAMSPNFAFDEHYFAKSLMNYDYYNGKPHYFFLSMANECEKTGWGEHWRESWNMVKNQINSTEYPDYISFTIKEFPEYSHMKGYLPGLMGSLKDWALYRHSERLTDTEYYPVHIELTGDGISGDVYITGNQDGLANWNAEGVKMTEVNENTRSIDLMLRLPAEFKFTCGSWETEIVPNNAYPGNLRIGRADRGIKKFEI